MRVPDILFFQDQDELPRPPDKVRIVEVQARPLPDGRRVWVQVTLTPFVECPSFDVTLLRPDGTVERTLSVVNALERTTALTMHLGRADAAPEYVARVELLRNEQTLDTRQVRLSIPAATDPTR
jgi:hypothetical protein